MAIYYVDNAYYAALEYLEDDDGGDQPARAVIPPNPLDLIDKQTYICRKSRAVNLISLKQMCLENVARNMDSVWCKDFVENWSGQMMLYFLGPFEQIAGGCVFELMEILRSKNCLHYRYLPSLITGRLETLNLKDTKNMNKLLSPIRFRCEINLKILNLENCSGMKESNLCLTLQNLKRLEHLNLRNTGISDNILESIGSCTFPLQRLQVSDNEKITNQGVHQLCNKHFANHLKAVSVEFTDVNIEGIFHLLESLPKLEVLEHISTTDAVLNWKLKYRDKVLNLRQLKLDLSAYTNEELYMLVMTCKQLTDLSFTSSAAVTQDALLPFLDMAKVSKLSSNCVLIPEMSWFMHLGQSMTHIDIGCVSPCATQIDLSIIGSSCPKLMSLSLRNVNMVESKTDFTQGCMFKTLHNVQLQNVALANNVPETLKFIFCHTHSIQRIELCLFCLAEGFMESVFSACFTNPKVLFKLKVVSFVKCQNLNDVAFNHFLCSAPRLEELHFHENANVYFITRLIAHNKMNVKVVCDKTLEADDL
ncbi:uncharacterized protein LOC135938693 [Cloeon dipterum]|uniref:uncharacterized protein LOC135938693 n=1 Tax=Cloeon dipterum TaxID=197152 RepID=UPI00321F6D64